MSLSYTPVSKSSRLAAFALAVVFSTATLGAVVLGMTGASEIGFAQSAPAAAVSV
ncbi:MAG TPA: hypothetical protein VFV25_01085 [Methylibium sp.]